MTKVNRRRFVKGSLSTLSITGAVHAQNTWSAKLFDKVLHEQNSAMTFPDDVSPWHTGTTGHLPRTGFSAPADFDYPLRGNLPFAHGVASGDPLTDSVIIWSRITLTEYPNPELEGEWRVALDPSMTTIVQSGSFTTSETQDWTIKLDVSGLLPYHVYYYQFFYQGAESIVGRTRTAPLPQQEVDNIRVAVTACCSYFSGYMNGYGRIADRKDLDLVINCGDYIYDFPDNEEKIRIPNNWDSDDNVDFRTPRNLNEVRRRYALYRSDLDLYRAHQQHPFLIIWDNHDIQIRGVADEDSYQAYWEWTPTRQPDANDIFRGYRAYQYGQALDLIVIDRHYSRHYPETERVNDNQIYLGITQNAWLREQLLESKARGAQWRMIVNQAFMAQLHLINPPASIDPYIGKLFPEYKDGVILEDRQWDGFPEEREALFRFLRDQHIDNNLVVTGDMHMNWASDLHEDPNNLADYGRTTGRGSVGVEFAPSSISRGGADETIAGAISESNMGLAARKTAKKISRILEQALSTTNKNVQFMDWVEHGYGIVDISNQRSLFEFWWTPILEASTQERLGKQMICRDGRQHMAPVLFSWPSSRDNDEPLAPETE